MRHCEVSILTTLHSTSNRRFNPGIRLNSGSSEGFNARRTDMDALQASALQRSRLVGGNVRIEATGGDRPEDQGGTLTLAGTTVDTPGTLALEADQIALATQSTRTDTRHESHGRDIA